MCKLHNAPRYHMAAAISLDCLTRACARGKIRLARISIVDMSGASLFCGINFVSFGLSPSLILPFHLLRCLPAVSASKPMPRMHRKSVLGPIAICLFQMSSRAPGSRFSLQISLFFSLYLAPFYPKYRSAAT